MSAGKTGIKEAIRFFEGISRIEASVDDEHAKTIASALKEEYAGKQGMPYYSTTK